MHHFYGPAAVVVWNGFPVPASSLQAFFSSSLPVAKFSTTSVDCQPVPGVLPGSDGNTAMANILVAVAGEIDYGKNVIKTFSQTFLLVQDTSKPKAVFIIASDTFREVGATTE